MKSSTHFVLIISMLSLAGPIQDGGPDLAFDPPSGASNSRRSGSYNTTLRNAGASRWIRHGYMFDTGTNCMV
jgi:hypothetical protein